MADEKLIFTVSENGDAGYSSIEMALEAVAQLRNAGNETPAEIRLTDDAYYLSHTLELDESVRNTTIKGEKPCVILSGGMPVSGFRQTAFRGIPCVVAHLPDRADGWHFNDLYVGERRAKVTRYPQEGYLIPERVENPSTDLHAVSKWFIAKEGDLDGVTVTPSTELGYCHLWVDEHTPIERYDPATRRVDMAFWSRHTVAGGSWSGSTMHYWLENLPDGFAEPGQWYFSPDEQDLYYIPLPDDPPPEKLNAFVPLLRHVAVVSGDNIRFDGIQFSHTSGQYVSRDTHTVSPDGTPMASDCQSVCEGYGALEYRHAVGCRVENCVFTHYGMHGIAAQNGTKDLTVSGCLFTDGGAGGITVSGGEYGCPADEETCLNTITENVIDGMGRRFYAGCGILIRHSYGNTVLHNSISHVYYTGISVGWVWGFDDNISRDNRISHNLVCHIGAGPLSDMGGIYLLGRQPGTVVSHNLIYDVTSSDYGGIGLYSDEGSSDQVIEENVVYECDSQAYHLHFGHKNTLRRNIFIGGGEDVMQISRPTPADMRAFLGRDNVPQEGPCLIAEDNAVISEKCPCWQFGFEKTSVEELKSAVSFRHNLYAGETYARIDGKAYTLSEIQKIGLEPESRSVNLSSGDILQEVFSVMSENGITPPDISGAGVTKKPCFYNQEDR